MTRTIYVTATELSKLLDISPGHAYKLIRELNAELKKDGYITIAGKLPRAYLEKRLFGYTT